MECVKGSGYIRTLQNFGDCQLSRRVGGARAGGRRGPGPRQQRRLLRARPLRGAGARFLRRNKTYADGSAGSVYGQYPPLVNACRPPGEWQTYDILYTAPRFDAGRQAALARPPHGFPQRRAHPEQRRADRPDRLD
ncbi:MAG: DUF1080 domain-containing protein [Candidatus Moduliflexus flocculans]|nr:DUF1080 domain-containing protein [Candidatus Moduliflexus flocculans]